MKSSCVPTPTNERLLLIHQWQVEFCDGNHCAAALLQFFIYWHDIKLAMRHKNQQANQIAESHGEAGTQDESLYQFHTREELKAALLDLYSISAITQGKTLLVAKGAITTHRNPNPRYTYDNTVHFLLHPDNLLNFLNDRKREGPPVENDSTVVTKTTDSRLKTCAQSVVFSRTIPEITSETPPEITTESGGVCEKKIAGCAPSSACSGPTPTSFASLQGTGKKTQDAVSAQPEVPAPLTAESCLHVWPSVEALVDLYNTMAPDECPFVPLLSPGRRKMAAKALRARPEQSFWERVFRMIGKSPLLRGLRPKPGHENWTADFDWLLATKDGVENYMKVFDGRYL